MDMAEIRVQVADEVDRYLESAVRMGLFTNKAEIARAAIVQYMNSITLMSRGYDGEMMFSPEGRLYQLEYARGAASRGLSVAGIACSDGVVLAAESIQPVSGPAEDGELLMMPVEKITMVNENVIVGTSGLVMDANLVVEALKGSKFESDDELKSGLREIYKPYLYKRDVRPLGVGLIIGSVLDGAHLYEVDASGAIVEYRATCIGRRKDDAIKILGSKYRAMGIEDAKPLLIEALGNPKGSGIVSLSAKGKGKK